MCKRRACARRRAQTTGCPCEAGKTQPEGFTLNLCYRTIQTSAEMKIRRIVVNDLMQQGYVYLLTEPVGRNFHPGFTPELTPKQMLNLGVFGGKYLTYCTDEFPADWFGGATLCAERHVSELNFFKVNASQPLRVWREKGWIYWEDPRGWFQWYCRYFRVGVVPMTSGKFGDGAHYGGTRRRLRNTVLTETGVAGGNSDRLYFTGPTTLEEYEAARC